MELTPDEFCKKLRKDNGEPEGSTKPWDITDIYVAANRDGIEGIFLNEELDKEDGIYHWGLLTDVKKGEIKTYDPTCGPCGIPSKIINGILVTKSIYSDMRKHGFETSDEIEGSAFLVTPDSIKQCLDTLDKMGYKKKLLSYEHLQKPGNDYDCALYCLFKAKEADEVN
jgi:hypothetical protein